MRRVTVTARETFPYADLNRYTGMSFSATEEDARILVMAGKVVIATESEEATEDPQEVPVEKPVTRRRYRRKDIVPEP